MCNLYLVRHGETDYNAEGIEMGQLDIPLSDAGIQQAESLARRFSGVSLAGIYSSPLKRSRETAELIASHHDVSVDPKPELRERSYGDFEGKSVSEIQAHLNERDTNWSAWNTPTVKREPKPSLGLAR